MPLSGSQVGQVLQRGSTARAITPLRPLEPPAERQLFTRIFGIPTPFLQLGTFMGLDGFSALAVDIITDPWTWLTFGVGGLSKMGRGIKFATEFSKATKAGRILTSTEIATEIVKTGKIAAAVAKNPKGTEAIFAALKAGDPRALQVATKELNKISKLGSKDKTLMKELANLLHHENKFPGAVPPLGQTLQSQARAKQRGLLKASFPFPFNKIGNLEFFEKTIITGEPVFKAVDMLKGVRAAPFRADAINKGAKVMGVAGPMAKLEQAAEEAFSFTRAVATGEARAARPRNVKDATFISKIQSPGEVLGLSDDTDALFKGMRKTERVAKEVGDPLLNRNNEIFNTLRKDSKAAGETFEEMNVLVARVQDGQLTAGQVPDFVMKAADAIKNDITDPIARLFPEIEQEGRFIGKYLTHIHNIDEMAKGGVALELEEKVLIEWLAKNDIPLEYAGDILLAGEKNMGKQAFKRMFGKKKKFGPIDLERLGNSAFSLDAEKVNTAYIKGAVKKHSFEIPGGFIEGARRVEDSKLLEQSFPVLKKFAVDRANAFRGVPGATQQALDSMIAQLGGDFFVKTAVSVFGEGIRKTAEGMISSRKITQTIGGLQFISKIAGNLGAAGINLTQTPINTFTKIGLRGTLTGAKGYFTKAGRLAAREAGVIENVTKLDADVRKFKGVLGKLSDVLSLPFAKAEEFNRTVAFLGAQSEALKAGKSSNKALQFALDVVDDTQFIYGQSDRIPALDNPIGRIIGQFKSFAVKEIEFIMRLEGQEIDRFVSAVALLGGPAAFGVGFLLRDADPDAPITRAVESIQGLSLAGIAGIDVSSKLGIGFVPDVASVGNEDLLSLMGPSVGGVRSLIGAISEEISGVPSFPGKRELLRELPAGVQIVRILDFLKSGDEDGIIRDKFGRIKFKLTPEERRAMLFGQTPTRIAELRRQMDRRREASKQHSDRKRALIQQIVDGRGRGDERMIEEALVEARENGISIVEKDIRRFLQTSEVTQEERQFRGVPREVKALVPLVGGR